MVKILALDPAETTGWAVFDSGKLLEYGIKVLQWENEGDAVHMAYEAVVELLEMYQPDEIAIEDFFFSGKKCMGANINLYIRGGMLLAANLYKMPYLIISHSVWYRFITGRFKPSKEDKAKYKTLATKITVQDALYQRYGLKFPNYTIVNNKRCVFKYDQIDAIGIGIFYLFNVHHIRDITTDIECPENDIKKPVKYIYPTLV